MNIPKHGNFCMLLGSRPPDVPDGYALSDPGYVRLKKRLMSVIRRIYREQHCSFATGSALGADFILLDALATVKSRSPSLYIQCHIEDTTRAMFGWSKDMREAFVNDLDRCNEYFKTPPQTNAAHVKMSFECAIFCSRLITLWDNNQHSSAYQVIQNARELTIEHIEIIV